MNGIEGLQNLLVALTDLGVIVAKVMKDDKIDVKDVPVVIGEMLKDVPDFMAAIASAHGVPKEVGLLSDEQAHAILSTVLKMVHTIKET